MITEKVYSPILDPSIKDHIASSPIWEECYHENEERPEGLYCYHIKFDDLKPIQVTKIVKSKQ